MDISRPADYFIACYTVLTRPKKVETAVHGCTSWLSVWTLSCRCPIKLFCVISALHHCLLLFLFLADQIFYRSYVTGNIFVCSSLHHHVKLCNILNPLKVQNVDRVIPFCYPYYMAFLFRVFSVFPFYFAGHREFKS